MSNSKVYLLTGRKFLYFTFSCESTPKNKQYVETHPGIVDVYGIRCRFTIITRKIFLTDLLIYSMRICQTDSGSPLFYQNRLQSLHRVFPTLVKVILVLK